MWNNTELVTKNITEQITEAQLKLGFMKETMRFYYPLSSLNRMLGTSLNEAQAMCEELQKRCPSFRFGVHQGRIEVSVPPDYVEYVYQEVSVSPFLAALIKGFQKNHSLSLTQIKKTFAEFGSYVCREMPEGTDFDYVIFFEDPAIDDYYYCIKMEMGHTIYHRFLKEDYESML